MSNFSKRILAVLVSVCLLMPCVPVVADVETVVPATEKLERVERKLDLETVPEVIGTELATERKHLERRYDKEESLYKVVFENADGTETLYLFDYPVKYETKSGKIKDIKLDIKQDAKKPGTFVAADHKVQTTFSKELSDGIKLKDEDVSVTLQPKLPVTSVMSQKKIGVALNEEAYTAKLLDDKTVSYRYDDKTSLEYSLTYTGFKEDIVVSEYTGQTEYEFTLLTEGLKLEQNDGSYYLMDENGEIKATLGDIIIFTADERNNAFGSMTDETIRENQEYKLTIHVDAEYLRDEATVYPIRIDPTIEINYDNNGTGGIEDVTINSTAGSSGTSGSLFVGVRENYGISRTLMKFPELDLSVIPSADCITSATVELRDIMCEAEAMSVYCHIFTGNIWSESTANWSNVNPTSYVATAMTSCTVSYAEGVKKTTKHRYGFNITQAVKEWKSETYSQDKGIVFAANASIESRGTIISKTFASYNRASNKPSLVVNYNSIADGKYAINNLNSRTHLTTNLEVKAGSHANSIMDNGMTIEGLGATMIWAIKKTSSGYTIATKNNQGKYLAVSLDASSNAINMYTSTSDTVHPCCLWNIIDAGNGAYYLKSVMKNGYLYYDGTSLSTISSIGSTQEQACSWRLAKEMDVKNYELDISSTKFGEWDLAVGYRETISQFLKIIPKNAIWSDLSDFSFEGYNTEFIDIETKTGLITPKKAGMAVVNIIHKPTGHKWSVDVLIRNSQYYLGNLSSWKNAEGNRVASWNGNVKVYFADLLGGNLSSELIQAYSTATSQWSSALGITITWVNVLDTADIIIYTGTREEFIEKGKNVGSAANENMAAITNPYLGDYVGYYVYNNSAKALYEMRMAEINVYCDSSMTLDDYRNVFTHELGHALGYLGHSEVETDVMYYASIDIYTLSDSEKAYMAQFYN